MIKIDLPWIDPALLPNNADGKHWRSLAHSKQVARFDGRMAARMAAKANGIELLSAGDHSLSIVFSPPRKPGPDLDNALKAMKHTLDGIAEALGINDRRFNPITITRGQSVAGGRVTVIIDDMPF